jgi:hypothetical protein
VLRLFAVVQVRVQVRARGRAGSELRRAGIESSRVLGYLILTHPAFAPQVVAPVQLIPPPGNTLVSRGTGFDDESYIAANPQLVR